MKIIKSGEIRRNQKIKRFECLRCGCIFEADNIEYDSAQGGNEIIYGCKCPTCGDMVWNEIEDFNNGQ